MKLYNEGHNVSLCVSDIETLSECTDLGFFNPDTGEWSEWEISEYRNDLYKFVKWYSPKNWKYMVWFNGIGFDCQVIQYILNNYEDWYDYNGKEVAGIVYKFVQRLIDDGKYGIRPPYYENQFLIRPIDVYTLFGLDNEARRSSLKKCEFQMDWHSVEEMPIHHTRKDLTKEEIQIVKNYRRNDVMATYELFKIAKGETEMAAYKGKNLFEIRAGIQEEFGVDCLNMSDIALGDAIMKHSYAKAKKINMKDIPKKGTFRKEIRLKHCIPSYVSFKTKKMQEVLKDLKGTVLKQTEKFERKFEFYGTNYTLAMGGLHAVNKDERWKTDEQGRIRDWDVQSFYPNIMKQLGIFPYHLSKEFLNTYILLYDRRIQLKPLAKGDKKIKGVVEGIKLMLNSVFGKMGNMDTWLYDKQALFNVTIAGQLTLLMLIEMLELEGIHVFSANTDGITFKTNEEEKAKKIWTEWEGVTKMALEEAEYKWVYYASVNGYIAENSDGTIKKKDVFLTDHDLWKNKSARIVPLALEAYFTKGVDPQKFISEHKNIYDFCIMTKATGQQHLEEQGKDGRIVTHKKLIRYYLSNSSEWQLYKRGTGTTGKPMNVCQNASNELGEIYTQYFNQFEQKAEYHVDVEQYVYRCYKIIDGIENTRRLERLVENKSQLKLF